MRPRPWATFVLIALNAIDFLWLLATGNFNDNYSLLAHGALFGEAVKHGEWWRIVTGAFEHGGYLHILFNMVALYQVGSFVEMIAGRWRMLALYFIAMLGSGLAVTYFQPDAVTVGASGAIFGLFGALVAIGLRLGKAGRSLISQTLPIIAINLGLGFALPNISNAGHIGGLISGFLAALALFMMQRRRVVEEEQSEADELAGEPQAALAGVHGEPAEEG